MSSGLHGISDIFKRLMKATELTEFRNIRDILAPMSTCLHHAREGGGFEGSNTNSPMEVGTQVTCVAAWCHLTAAVLRTLT